MPPVHGTCPFCKKLVTNLNVCEVEAFITLQKKIKALVFLCPSCAMVLGTSPDPR